jgi:hypothetical protein
MVMVFNATVNNISVISWWSFCWWRRYIHQLCILIQFGVIIAGTGLLQISLHGTVIVYKG